MAIRSPLNAAQPLVGVAGAAGPPRREAALEQARSEYADEIVSGIRAVVF